MAKKTRTPPVSRKAPKALTDILKNAPKAEPPPPDQIQLDTKLKGRAALSLEVGGNEKSALLAVDNDGTRAISLASPFGRPALEPGQAPPPLLTPEEDGFSSELNNEPKFDNGWGAIQKENAPNATQPPIEENPPGEEENPFEETAEAVGGSTSGAPEEGGKEDNGTVLGDDAQADRAQVDAILEEMSELRARVRELKEENAVLGNKNGAQMTLAALKVANNTVAILQEQLAATPKNTGTVNLPEWQGKDLRLLFPCYKTTNPATAACLIALALDFGRDKIGFLPALGDARIANARNRLADDFLKTGAQWALFIDDDMVLPVGRPAFTRGFIGASPQDVPDAVLNVHIVQRLLAANQKLVGATYFGRRSYSPAMFKEGINDPVAYQKAKTVSGEVLPTEWVATGCLLVHRDVFLGIQKACPEIAPTGNQTLWDFFQEGRGEEEGEDVMFCRRAKKAGFQPHVDTGAQCFHVGYQAFGFWNTTNLILQQNQPAAGGKAWWK